MTTYLPPGAFDDPTPSVGQSLGQSVGSGLSTLLNYKMQQMSQEKEAQQAQAEQSQQAEDLSQLLATLGGGTPPQEGVPQGGAPQGEGAIKGIQQKTPDDVILALTQTYPKIAEKLQKQNEAMDRQNEAIAKREHDRALPVLKRADERAEEVTQKGSSLALMENAIQEGDLSYFSADNLASVTGIDAFRTAKGAQFIAAGKEYFLGSLKRAGARPNQWIEQQIQKMLPKIGRSKAANLTVVEALKSELAIEQKQMDLIYQFAQEDQDKYGYVKGNIGQRVRKELKTFADKEQDNLMKRLKAIDEGSGKQQSNDKIEKSEVIMTDPEGNRFAVEKKDVKAATNAGWKRTQ